MTLTTICAPVALAVRSIAPFCDEVRAAFGGTGDIALDLSAVEDPDLSVIQLVEAARRQAARDGAVLTLAHPATGPLAALLDRAGFADLSPTDTQFWFHGAA
ncbi:STAS domain-containing protein [Sphingomonas mollis]|uniref:STAS domain-containing protein n=1 Tax=Sphingomonas mollis TaxID=2795726 RepID=A0ABS0XRJ7_9SPHN|nr:STAS domain-containing protein [Sphingomonas sp. BT553]MBJ6122358.1 STAS domain-containing protein [Sphingomonas sp. BT553]